jgi:hypothetical protein
MPWVVIGLQHDWCTIATENMALSQITIVVVPRGQFSETQVSLERIFAHNKLTLIYVDGNAPDHVRRYP